jgi:Ankyrin repeats (3 copies)
MMIVDRIPSDMDRNATNLPHQAVALSERRFAGMKRKLSDKHVDPCLVELQSPADFVLAVFKANHFDVIENPSLAQLVPYVKPTPAMIDAYKIETIRMVREKKLDELRKSHQEGDVLNCCNRFGESLIHLACRRGCTEIVTFFVKEAGVSLYVRDDYGRTPLHDACWTAEPTFDLVEFLVNEAPELLCIKDVRGHTPLNYVRKEHWSEWLDFLESRKEMLRPKVTLAYNACG